MQIVLNESLNTAPKLTNDQLAVVAIVFLFRYTQNFGILNHKKLGEYFDRHVLPFSNKLIKNNSCYQHLEFSGCGSISVMEASLESILSKTYAGLFLKGFDIAEIVNRGVSIGQDARFFIPCLNDSAKIQINAINIEGLEKALDTASVSLDDKAKIIALFELGKMSEAEVRSKCTSISPYMEQVFEVWASSVMKQFTLTSVGIAIGHANIKRLVGEFSGLSIWIN